MTDAQRTITEWLRMLADCTRKNLRLPGMPAFHYAGIGDFLLQHGQCPRPTEAVAASDDSG